MAEPAVYRRRWTVDSFEEAVTAGVFGSDPRVELIEGEVVQVSPIGPEHGTASRRLRRRIDNMLDPSLWTVGSQEPVRLDDHSEPQPDVWVARGPETRYDHRHPRPADLVLVIEVSDTSLAFDRTVKLPIYAAAGVPEVWIVSLGDQAVHRFTDPEPSARSYRSAETFAWDRRVRARLVDLEVAVDAIMPAR